MPRYIAGCAHALGSPLPKCAILALMVAACSSLTVDGHGLEGTHWRAVSVAGQAPIRGSEPTLRFDRGLVSGSMGCNTYSSQQPATITNGTIQIGTTLTTLGRCVQTGGDDAPVMAIEFAFQDTLWAAHRIEFRGDQLVVSGSAGEIVFNRDP